MIWDRLRRESNTKAQSLMCECVCLIQNKYKKIIVPPCFRECVLVCFCVRLIPSPLLVCVIVSIKKMTKNQNDRMISYWVNKYNCQQKNCGTFMNKEGIFFPPNINIYVKKQKKKMEVYMMCQNISILLILPILAPKRRWNKIHLGLWLAEYDACARSKHKCNALIFPKIKTLKFGEFFFFQLSFGQNLI